MSDPVKMRGAVLGRFNAESSVLIGNSLTAENINVYWDQNSHDFVACNQNVFVAKKIERGALAIVRGHMAIAGNETLLGTPAAEWLLDQFLSTGEMPIDKLMGAFTAVVMNSTRAELAIYRNMMGDQNTYYTVQDSRLHFSANLMDILLTGLTTKPVLDSSILPVYFLFRYVPGRKTLLGNVKRILPGELIHFRNGKLTANRVDSFAGLRNNSGIKTGNTEELDRVLHGIEEEHRRLNPDERVLLSGGVDSTYLQAIWRHGNAAGTTKAFVVVTPHVSHREDSEYAQTAANELEVDLVEVNANEDFSSDLIETINATGETPNHVQACYFLKLAKTMVNQGYRIGISGEAADGIFGVATTNYVQNADLLRKICPFGIFLKSFSWLAKKVGMRRCKYYAELANHLSDYSYLQHPVNQQAVFSHLGSVEACFGTEQMSAAFEYRRNLVAEYDVPPNPVSMLNCSNLVTSSVDSASYWNTIFESAGGGLHSPFLDSRVLGFAFNLPNKVRFPFRKPKRFLKDALATHLRPDFAFRKKRGFGQPIFEWMARGGQLRDMIESIQTPGYVPEATLVEAKENPNWFLYSLLCLDLWSSNYGSSNIRCILKDILDHVGVGSDSEA